MAGYCTLAEVASIAGQPLFKDANDQSNPQVRATKPSATDVNDMIDDIASEIDFILSGIGYELPIDRVAKPKVWSFLSQLNATGAAVRVSVNVDDIAKAEFLERQYQSKVKMLKSGDIPLVSIADEDTPGTQAEQVTQFGTMDLDDPFPDRDTPF